MAMWYAWAVGLYFIPTGIGWIIFSNFSMKRIEKQIKANDIDPGYNWDGVGARIFYYAFAIIATEKFAPRLNQLIDTEQVRKIATHQDWLRAIYFVTLTYSWLGIALFGIAIGAAG